MLSKSLFVSLLFILWLIFFGCGGEKESTSDETSLIEIEETGDEESTDIPSIYDEILEQEEASSDQTSSELEEVYESTTEHASVSELEEPNIPAPEPKKKEVEKPEPVKEKAAMPIKEPSKKREVLYKPAFSTSGMFVVQVGSYQEKRRAINAATRLKNMGYPAYVVESAGPSEGSEGTFYRVRIGNFENRMDAKAFGENVLAKKGYQYWVDNKMNER